MFNQGIPELWLPKTPIFKGKASVGVWKNGKKNPLRLVMNQARREGVATPNTLALGRAK
jgi:hypothetical protein